MKQVSLRDRALIIGGSSCTVLNPREIPDD